MSEYRDYNEDDHEEIREALVGRHIVDSVIVEDSNLKDWYGTEPAARLILDDGTILYAAGNDGGCSCYAGCYYLEHLGKVDNVITNVEFENKPDTDAGGDYTEYDGHYTIFVFADNEKVNLLTFEGSDGNGYYGTGYHVRIVKP